MAGSRSVLTLLTAAALSATGWTQDSPPIPGATAPNPGSAAPIPGGPPPPPRELGSGPEGPKPPGERRDGRPGWGGPKGEGRGWSKGPKENLTPEQMKERATRDLEKLTPEQRMEVWRATWAVLNMPTEKRQELIGMEDDRRKKVREEIDRMLQNTGIKIPDDQRRKFFHRYFSGRREIEEQLKKEGEERRLVLTAELEGKLKQEFGSVKPDESPAPAKAEQ